MIPNNRTPPIQYPELSKNQISNNFYNQTHDYASVPANNYSKTVPRRHSKHPYESQQKMGLPPNNSVNSVNR